MTIHLRRQIAMRTCQGIVDALPDGTVFPYRLTDVLPKYVLNLGSGKYSTNSIELNAGDSFSVPLPANYDVGQPLSCYFRCDGILKVVIVDATLGSSTILVKATSGSTDGDHKGVLMWQGNLTSITVSIPATFPDTIIDYFLWEVPDLTDPLSWQTGIQALGYLP